MNSQDPKESHLETLRRQINSLPLHRFLGLQVRRYGQGVSSCSLVIGPNVLNRDGFVGQGSISTLATVGAEFALATLLGEGRVGVSLDHHLTMLSPANSGRLIAKAKVVNLRARLALINTRVYDTEGELIASGGTTIYILPRDQYSSWRQARSDWSEEE